MSVTVTCGECVAVLGARSGAQFDACVTDPPYHLTSVVERFGKAGAAPAQFGSDGAYQRASRGFMGQEWDGGDVAFRAETWRAVFDRLKPGAHLAAFSGTRTYHRMAVAIEDAGFEIRDQLAWVYGSGFPKSHDVAKAIDRAAGACGQVEPAGDPVARLIPGADQARDGWEKTSGREYQPGAYRPATAQAARWQGWGTALKPAWEPICLARKPLGGTVAQSVLAHGTGALNIDACRVEAGGEVISNHGHGPESGRGLVFGAYAGVAAYQSKGQKAGRWPANFLHDESEEVAAFFPVTTSGILAVRTRATGWSAAGEKEEWPGASGDTGSAARFFYSAKAGPLDRLGSAHPTVKPVDLMRWLLRLVTPSGGLVLDPFAGSGTTGVAALAEGMRAELIELEPAHVADIEAKLAHLRGDGARIVERHLKRRAARAGSAGPLL